MPIKHLSREIPVPIKWSVWGIPVPVNTWHWEAPCPYSTQSVWAPCAQHDPCGVTLCRALLCPSAAGMCGIHVPKNCPTEDPRAHAAPGVGTYSALPPRLWKLRQGGGEAVGGCWTLTVPPSLCSSAFGKLPRAWQDGMGHFSCTMPEKQVPKPLLGSA